MSPNYNISGERQRQGSVLILDLGNPYQIELIADEIQVSPIRTNMYIMQICYTRPWYWECKVWNGSIEKSTTVLEWQYQAIRRMLYLNSNIIDGIETTWSGIVKEVIIYMATSVVERLLVPRIPPIMDVTIFEPTYKRIFITTFHGRPGLSIFDYPIHGHTLVEVNMLGDAYIWQIPIWNEYYNIYSPDGISNNKLLMVIVY